MISLPPSGSKIFFVAGMFTWNRDLQQCADTKSSCLGETIETFVFFCRQTLWEPPTGDNSILAERLRSSGQPRLRTRRSTKPWCRRFNILRKGTEPESQPIKADEALATWLRSLASRTCQLTARKQSSDTCLPLKRRQDVLEGRANRWTRRIHCNLIALTYAYAVVLVLYPLVSQSWR